MADRSTNSEPNRWAVLAVVGVAQLMVTLDFTIMNIALPSLGFLLALVILPGRAKPGAHTLSTALARHAIANCHHVDLEGAISDEDKVAATAPSLSR